MSLELGIAVGMPILCFILAYFSVNENQFYFKWFFLILSFGFMTASMDVFRRLATDNAMSAGVIGMFETLTIIMTILMGLMLLIFFILAVQYAIEMYFPYLKGKKTFNKGG